MCAKDNDELSAYSDKHLSFGEAELIRQNVKRSEQDTEYLVQQVRNQGEVIFPMERAFGALGRIIVGMSIAAVAISPYSSYMWIHRARMDTAEDVIVATCTGLAGVIFCFAIFHWIRIWELRKGALATTAATLSAIVLISTSAVTVFQNHFGLNGMPYEGNWSLRIVDPSTRIVVGFIDH